MLSFGQHVTALAAGRLDPDLNNDILVIGSPTNLMAYDVEHNSELFYKDVGCFKFLVVVLINAHQLPDGANSLVIGRMSDESEPLVFAGGNCAIQGYDCEGVDRYWTVCVHRGRKNIQLFRASFTLGNRRQCLCNGYG